MYLRSLMTLIALLLPACNRGEAICEDQLDNDCNDGCRCPAELECIQFSSIVGNSGSNSCTKDCAQQSECPEGTHCVEVKIYGSAGPEIHGQCWPECVDNSACRGETNCSATKLYQGGAPIRACF
jgi:hypothetical protein